jgi:predicted RNA-binding protein YlxR (DUF448 family)
MGCREHKTKDGLLRVARLPDGRVLLDTRGKSGGRGMYVCPDAVCLRRIRKNRAPERCLKTRIPEDVYAELDALCAAV